MESAPCHDGFNCMARSASRKLNATVSNLETLLTACGNAKRQTGLYVAPRAEERNDAAEKHKWAGTCGIESDAYRCERGGHLAHGALVNGTERI